MGVDEKVLISILGNLYKDYWKLFRKVSKSFFVEDEERVFEKCYDYFVKYFKIEFFCFIVSFLILLLFILVFIFFFFGKIYYII